MEGAALSAVVNLAAIAVSGMDEVSQSHRASRAKGSLVGLFSSDDYPNEALRKNETGTVSVQLTIDPDGRVSDCQIKLSALSPSLDAATCRVLSERARFEPARNRAGRAVTDKYSQRITWKIPAADAEPVGGIDFRVVVGEHADGRPDCRILPDKNVVPDATFCENAREQARKGLARIGRSLSVPYRAVMTFQTLLGDQVPSVSDPSSTVRSAARLRINEAGHVTGCQPLVKASLNGDDGTDLCIHADAQGYERLPATVKNRSDRMMLMIRSLTYEAGEPAD